jgi:hypothetical protein
VSQLQDIAQHIKERIDNGTTLTAMIGMRNAGNALPACVFEITSATVNMHMPATGTNLYDMTVEVNLFAGTTFELLGLVDTVLTAFHGVATNLGITSVCTAQAFTIRTETQADGAEGDERVATITLQLQAGL